MPFITSTLSAFLPAAPSVARSYNCTSSVFSLAVAARPLSYFQGLLSLWPQLSQRLAHCTRVSGSCPQCHGALPRTARCCFRCIPTVGCSIGRCFIVPEIGDKEAAVSGQGHQADVKGVRMGRKEQGKRYEW